MPPAESAPAEAVAELAQWIRLMHTSGVGAVTARRLLSHFGLPGQIFRASRAALSHVAGDAVADALLAKPHPAYHHLLERTCAWLERPGNRLLTLADAAYPQSLLTIYDPPVLLYVKGRAELLQRDSIAIVGSRNATAQGLSNAERFAESLAGAGFGIVSGMAGGIDAAAHRGALAAGPDAGGTVAVIGTGIDIIYPARNRALALEIADAGCIVSEYPLGTPAISANFPRRNRLISGLSKGVLVIEAAAQSGSLITARVATEQGRDVYALPGSIHAPLSRGCHHLIKQGAKLVECAQDVLEELGCKPRKTTSEASASTSDQMAPEHAALLAAIGFDPVDGDTLSHRSALDAAALSAQLLALEWQGLLEVLPGGLYRRLG